MEVNLLILIPLITSFVLLFGFKLSEKSIARLVFVSLTLQTLSYLLLLSLWAVRGFGNQVVQVVSVSITEDYSFTIEWLVDPMGLVYLGLVALLSNAVGKFSRYYLHREVGYRRFFVLIFLMIAGSNILALANTLDLFFAGWEFIGVSSFLLISFYWNRRQAVKNAFLVFCVYRICDAGFLAATMLSHSLWHEGHHFAQLSDSHLLDPVQFVNHPELYPVVLGLLLFAALGKSAQFPFLNWLPRALEGPTPSSAIFYGALSIHAGVFLLLRTQPLWISSMGFRVSLALIGLISAVLATLSGRIQSNIKSQIAYAAIAQVGLIFIELSMGWTVLPVVHLALHALLRSYQLLVSPSVVAHGLRVIQFEGEFVRASGVKDARISSAWRLWWYRLALAEFWIWPSFSLRMVWAASKRLQLVLAMMIVLASCWVGILPALAVGAMIFSLSSNQRVIRAWIFLGAGLALSWFGVLGIDPLGAKALLYFGSAGGAWLIGFISLWSFRNLELNDYYGHLNSSRLKTYLMVGVVCVIAGLPLSPAFIGEDLLLHTLFEVSPFHSVLMALTLTAGAISSGNVLVKVFFGHRGTVRA